MNDSSNLTTDEKISILSVIGNKVNDKASIKNTEIWSGIDSRILLFISQIGISLIAVGFGMYLIIEHDNNEGYLSLGSSLIMYVLGFITKNPVVKKKKN